MTFTICERVELADGREVWSHGSCDAQFNVHNQGGMALLRSIGVEPDSCGTLDAADVVARCVTWRAVDAPARGVAPASQGVGARGARWYEGGVDADYVAVRVGWLEELARLALASGPDVQVGWA